MIEIPTLAEYLAPRMKPTQEVKRKLVQQHYMKSGDNPVVCSMIVGCSERWAYQVISEYKKSRSGLDCGETTTWRGCLYLD